MTQSETAGIKTPDSGETFRNAPRAALRVAQSNRLSPLQVAGKFFFAGARKFFLKGVTYGPFPYRDDGSQFPEPAVTRQDFRLMQETGVNTLRVFTVPPIWLLDLAEAQGLRVLVGIPWAQHVAFLDDPAIRAQIAESIGTHVEALGRHPAILAYLVGNEIPPDIIRWHGADRVGAFLAALAALVRERHPGALISYANFPSTEYLTVDFADFLCFNVYLHDETAFRKYLARLHNLAFDKPLVLTEFGMDSLREGRAHQAETLDWQIHAAFELGCAGTCVFSWTDEWFTGGHLIDNWAFGLVDAARTPKPALDTAKAQYSGKLPPPLRDYPRVSVVVCAYNAERTLQPCLHALQRLNYPDYEVIVVNDGSTDRTLEIAQSYSYCRIVTQANLGLSVARNVGAEAATGEIVAYTDADCVADPDWLTYLVSKMMHQRLHAIGGPNYPPPEDDLIPAAVAVSPGGPTHVLIDDEVAEHIAGCNMAFRRDTLLRLGGFDPVFRAAGDDVDICWRFQNAGFLIGFAPAATVWHFRRNTVGAYLGQQGGYGKAEALVYAKHPSRFNLFGQARWLGRIYGDLSASLLLSRRPVIYSGSFGRGLFQTMYEPPSSLAAYLPLTFEWNVASVALALGGLAARGWWLVLVAPLVLTWSMCLTGAFKAKIDPPHRTLKARLLIAALIYLGPIVRGWARLNGRIGTLRTQDPMHLARGIPQNPPQNAGQKARISWRDRAFQLSFWGEREEEKEALIGGLIRFLSPRKYFLQSDDGWNDWDLKVSRGLWSRAYILVCGEHHGGGKRLLRLKCRLRLSRLSVFVLRLLSAAALLALILQEWSVSILLILIALGCFLHIAVELRKLGRILHRAADDVAEEAGLAIVPIS